MKPPPGLAYTTMAYKTIPMFWTGTAMLLVGVVLVAALPSTARRPRVYAPVGGVRPIGLPPDRAEDDRELMTAAPTESEAGSAPVESEAGSAPAESEADPAPTEATDGVDAGSTTAESEPVAAASAESEADPEPTEADVADEEKPQARPATERRLPLMPRKRPKN
jgi:hypothetical protein